MGSSENFCLRWNDFESNVSGAFRELRAESDFFDVTLACDDAQGRTLQAHKVILSACSTFFKQMLRNTQNAAPGHPNPMIYLRGVRMTDLESVLDFMYHGEVNVAQNDLNSFLAVAEDLQIKGLTQQTKDLPKNKGRRSNAGPAAKRRKQDQDDDDDDNMKNVKTEPSGGLDAGMGPSTSGVTAFDTTAEGATGYEDAYDDGYGAYGAEAGADDSTLIDQSMAGAAGAMEGGTDSTKGRHK